MVWGTARSQATHISGLFMLLSVFLVLYSSPRGNCENGVCQRASTEWVRYVAVGVVYLLLTYVGVDIFGPCAGKQSRLTGMFC